MRLRSFLLALLPLLAAPSASLAQKEIPKAEGHDQCPLGYVNTLGNHMRITHLLRGRSNQWRGLPRGLDEYWCWLLQKEERGSRHLLRDA